MADGGRSTGKLRRFTLARGHARIWSRAGQRYEESPSSLRDRGSQRPCHGRISFSADARAVASACAAVLAPCRRPSVIGCWNTRLNADKLPSTPGDAKDTIANSSLRLFCRGVPVRSSLIVVLHCKRASIVLLPALAFSRCASSQTKSHLRCKCCPNEMWIR